MNVLYLTDDKINIYTPILLYPEFEKIFILYTPGDYAINKNQIIKLLTDGRGFIHDNIGRINTPHIGGKADIRYVSGDNYRWEIIFEYQGKMRSVVCFHDFRHEEWPDEIQSINCIVGRFGELRASYDLIFKSKLREIYDSDEIENILLENTQILRQMVCERSSLPLKWFDTSNDENLPHSLIIEDGEKKSIDLSMSKIVITSNGASKKRIADNYLTINGRFIYYVVIKEFGFDWFNYESDSHCS